MADNRTISEPEAVGYPWIGCECCKGTVWVPFKMIRTKVPLLSAMTLDEVGAKMRCEKCGRRPERFYPARQSDAPEFLYWPLMNKKDQSSRKKGPLGRSVVFGTVQPDLKVPTCSLCEYLLVEHLPREEFTMAKKNRNRRRQQPPQPPTPPPVPPNFWGQMWEYRWAILRALPLGVFLPMTFFFGSVGPDDFSKNYASWARTWGLTDWADWLSLYATGPRVFWGAVLISSIYLAIAFVLPSLIRRASKDSAIVAVPVIVAIIVIIAVFGQYEMAITSERHVSEYQRTKIKESLLPVAANFSRALIVAAIDTPEAQGYASELMTALGFAGLKVASVGNTGTMMPPVIVRAIGTGVKGVFFQVEDPANPPKEVRILEKALVAAGIRIEFRHNVDFPKSDYALSVGLQ